jgi:predicted O-methyltransferase YrrM
MTSIPVLKRRSSAELDVFMDPIEFSQVVAIVNSVAPRHYLEWGSGGSTRALLESCPFIERYVAIEHDPEWYKAVADAIKDPRLALYLIESDEPYPPAGTPHKDIEAWDHRAETSASMMRSYIDFPRTLGIEFDVILVDGRSRSLCLREGYQLLREGGVMVLHDAQRVDYQAAISTFGNATRLEPWKQGQVCLIRRSDS